MLETIAAIATIGFFATLLLGEIQDSVTERRRARQPKPLCSCTACTNNRKRFPK